jgi:8-oxo-dGTP pyrophosphatase MutT (NUDIX family)
MAEIHRAGTMPVTKENKLVLISSNKGGDYVFPKGGIKPLETPIEAARRETLEEAGIVGVPEEMPFYEQGDCQWFILRVTRIDKVWKEMDYRTRVLLEIDDVIKNDGYRIRDRTVEMVRFAREHNYI